jgi:DNA-binding NarL/FixJ family response regulator
MIRIVIADDHPVVREGLAAILTTQPDFSLAGAATDGAQLVDLVTRLRPDVAIVDLAMPELDGALAIRQLAAVSPETRALGLTAFDSDERIISAIRAGARGYLLKGAPRAQIFEAVRIVAAGGSLLQPPVAARLAARVAAPPPVLGAQALRVLRLAAQGRANKEIAATLGISERTVKHHLSVAMTRLGAANRTEAVTLQSILGGHPDRRLVPGIEISTGSLGHGLSMAIGVALGLRARGSDRRVFALVGDAECNEGSIWEAVLLAPRLRLTNLTCIVVDNRSSSISMGDFAEKFAAFGWAAMHVAGRDHQALADALTSRDETRLTAAVGLQQRAIHQHGTIAELDAALGLTGEAIRQAVARVIETSPAV